MGTIIWNHGRCGGPFCHYGLCERLCAGRSPPDQIPYENDYCFGLDLSFVRRAEQRGDVFYDTDGSQRSPWEIFRSHGYNWGRLMLCSEPSYLGQGIDNVVENARELKRNGFHFALDYMISDDWSNPMRQPVPKSWDFEE
ncbi:MAG: glycosyl hydrolase 53 family protein [Candidatus Cryptobacteroides sp.]|jgi:arabinogalactan endo-1,4-beta-galactosidase